MMSQLVPLLEEWYEETIAYPPHAWLDDPREPLFTFMWDDQEFGFYAMSITYWAEVLMVSAVQRHLSEAYALEKFH